MLFKHTCLTHHQVLYLHLWCSSFQVVKTFPSPYPKNDNGNVERSIAGGAGKADSE